MDAPSCHTQVVKSCWPRGHLVLLLSLSPQPFPQNSWQQMEVGALRRSAHCTHSHDLCSPGLLDLKWRQLLRRGTLGAEGQGRATPRELELGLRHSSGSLWPTRQQTSGETRPEFTFGADLDTLPCSRPSAPGPCSSPKDHEQDEEL